MTSSARSELRIFCDYLDVTFSPDDCPYPDLNRFLLGHDFRVARDNGGRMLYVPPAGRGSLSIEHRPRFARVSASGGVCSYLRSIHVWDEYLHILATSPHKVTRVDASADLALDGADAIAMYQARFPDGSTPLTRKSLKIDYITAVRPDGRYTGTMSIGYGSAARFTAKVYDKAWEAHCKRGEVLPPTTRVEVTACKDAGATLRDASEPAALFWHIAAPALLNRPEGAPMWEPNTDYHPRSQPRDFNTAETLRRRVEYSAELAALSLLADDLGIEGRRYLLSLIQDRLEAPVGLPAAANQ